MSFEGFNESDFEVFAIPGFEARMPVLRAQVTPKLRSLGEELQQAMGPGVFTHVAQHMRRTVNPPEETWTALSPEPRSYKPFVHYRAAISAEKLRVVVFVEDDCREKETFASNLVKQGSKTATVLKETPGTVVYTISGKDGRPLPGAKATGPLLKAFGERLKQVKGQHAIFGIPIAREEVTAMNGSELKDRILELMAALRPIYELSGRR